jgi:hypothetical protein
MKLKSLPILTLTALVIGGGSLIAQPANDNCSGAISIQSAFGNPIGTMTVLGPYDNTTATTGLADPTVGYDCFGEPDGGGANPTLENTLWFTFTGDGGKYFIETADGPGITNYIDDGDTQIAIYTGACGSLVPFACNEDGPSSGPGGNPPYPAGLTINTSPGVVYYMMVDGFNFNGAISSGEYLIEVTQQLTIACTDPTVTIGTATANKTLVCPGDTVRFDISGVVTPTVGSVSGMGWLISNADLLGSNDPLNNPSVVAGYAVQNPSPAASFRTFINNGQLIGSAQVPYGTYYWTPVIFGNANIAVPPGTFMTQLTLDPSCTITGPSLAVNVAPPGSPLCNTGIADLVNGFGISNLYPVPVQNVLNFDLSSPSSSEAIVSIKDALGKEFMSENVRLVTGEKSFTFDVSKLASGVYFLSITSGNTSSVARFVKQ